MRFLQSAEHTAHRQKWNLTLKICRKLSFSIFFYLLGFCQPLHAEEAKYKTTSQFDSIPESEIQFTDIFSSSSKEYKNMRQEDEIRDIRLKNQINFLKFIEKNPEIHDWVGVVISRALTPTGDASIAIEIADNIKISTASSSSDMIGAITILRSNSNLFNLTKTLRGGEAIKFSGKFLKYKNTIDEDMIGRPDFFMMFTDFNLP